MRIVIFPNGTRVVGAGSQMWSMTGTVVSFGVNGFYTSGVVTYTFPNVAVATQVMSFLDAWQASPNDYTLDIAARLAQLPTGIASLSPNGGPAAGSFSVAVSGYRFQTGATVTIGSHVYATSFVDANDLTFNYAAELGAGVYDVLLTNPDATNATLLKAFTLT